MKHPFELCKTRMDFNNESKVVWTLSTRNSAKFYELIDMEHDDFNLTMLSQFNGFNWINTEGIEYVFLNESKAKDALEWVESRYLAVQLAGGVKTKNDDSFFKREFFRFKFNGF